MSLFKLRRRKQPYSSLDLSDELVQTWHDDGFVLIPGAVEQSVVEAINAEVRHYSGAERRVSGTNITVDVLHGRFGGKLMRLCDAPDEIFAGPVKINQLFTESAAVRLGTYAPAVIKTLGGLLGEAPVAILTDTPDETYAPIEGPAPTPVASESPAPPEKRGEEEASAKRATSPADGVRKWPRELPTNAPPNRKLPFAAWQRPIRRYPLPR